MSPPPVTPGAGGPQARGGSRMGRSPSLAGRVRSMADRGRAAGSSRRRMADDDDDDYDVPDYVAARRSSRSAGGADRSSLVAAGAGRRAGERSPGRFDDTDPALQAGYGPERRGIRRIRRGGRHAGVRAARRGAGYRAVRYRRIRHGRLSSRVPALSAGTALSRPAAGAIRGRQLPSRWRPGAQWRGTVAGPLVGRARRRFAARPGPGPRGSLRGFRCQGRVSRAGPLLPGGGVLPRDVPRTSAAGRAPPGHRSRLGPSRSRADPGGPASYEDDAHRADRQPVRLSRPRAGLRGPGRPGHR